MPLPSLFGDDEELGKKDDDLHRGHDDLVLTDAFRLLAGKVGPRTRRRRAIFLSGVGVLAALVLLIYTLRPSPGPPRPHRPHLPPLQINLDDLNLHPEPPPPPPPSSHLGIPPRPKGPSGPPPGAGASDGRGRELQYYGGPLEWQALPKSLHAATNNFAHRIAPQSVLFLAADLPSLGRLAPMACEMARWQRSVVHFVVMGRYDMSMEDLKRVNGVGASCEMSWHDARPDYAAYSNDERFALGVSAALDQLRRYLQPGVFIIDDGEEEPRFVKCVDEHAARFRSTVIRLPENAVRTMQWMTRLDHGSLSAWNQADIEILVRAPVGNSASLIRLLRSIANADYFDARYPHLTIELPADVDRYTEDFLNGFVWPPPSSRTYHPSLLTVRRRLPQPKLNPIEASMRLIESFYPASTSNSHVLLLSPEVELSPLYYHYLIYNLLEYRHASFYEVGRESASIFGISLISPTLLLDGSTKLLRPEVPIEMSPRNVGKDQSLTKPSPFLWQAPDTHATLYYSDKWKELHSFFNLRLRRSKLVNDKRIVTSSLPAFAEYFLELMRARGYFILYPNVPGVDFATAHNELYQPPEEFAPSPPPMAKQDKPLPAGPEEIRVPGPTAVPARKEQELAWAPLDAVLPSQGDLTELSLMPLLSYNGQKLTKMAVDRLAQSYAEEFRTSVGRCEADEQPVPSNAYAADDLFCHEEILDPYDGTAAAQPGKGQIITPSTGDIVDVRPPVWLPPPQYEDRQWVDEDGEWLPLPIAESEKNSMKSEFIKHLERQKGRSD